MTGSFTSTPSAWADWPLDREIVLTRLIEAPRDIVFAAWTAPARIQSWFGPEGFTLTTKEIDIRPGGIWRFDMIAPDGTVFPNRMVFLRLEEPSLIEIEHGTGRDDDPAKFRMLVTFDEQSNGKTVLTLRQMHPSREIRAEKLGFGAVEYGLQTLAKLATHVDAHMASAI
ncbi:SRPBCC family protein [Aquisalinus flavus]|uniref:ATPase n=1 Tax=Aquisalinus flavus TaxID=1526572 RepID=A0A8J2V3Z9_9PROT|nr:SRPBCC family protein [Aquisalinus flavus]MBD0427433.1 SRPBCC family protein [Aquisalinus flavus]UNE47236.1 ATPase [Aquisalinus flavus]GGD00991.1 ATPase [Aquisalinus flavus]